MKTSKKQLEVKKDNTSLDALKDQKLLKKKTASQIPFTSNMPGHGNKCERGGN